MDYIYDKLINNRLTALLSEKDTNNEYMTNIDIGTSARYPFKHVPSSWITGRFLHERRALSLNTTVLNILNIIKILILKEINNSKYIPTQILNDTKECKQIAYLLEAELIRIFCKKIKVKYDNKRKNNELTSIYNIYQFLLDDDSDICSETSKNTICGKLINIRKQGFLSGVKRTMNYDKEQTLSTFRSLYKDILEKEAKRIKKELELIFFRLTINEKNFLEVLQTLYLLNKGNNIDVASLINDVNKLLNKDISQEEHGNASAIENTELEDTELEDTELEEREPEERKPEDKESEDKTTTEEDRNTSEIEESKSEESGSRPKLPIFLEKKMKMDGGDKEEERQKESETEYNFDLQMRVVTALLHKVIILENDEKNITLKNKLLRKLETANNLKLNDLLDILEDFEDISIKSVKTDTSTNTDTKQDELSGEKDESLSETDNLDTKEYFKDIISFCKKENNIAFIDDLSNSEWLKDPEKLKLQLDNIDKVNEFYKILLKTSLLLKSKDNVYNSLDKLKDALTNEMK